MMGYIGVTRGPRPGSTCSCFGPRRIRVDGRGVQITRFLSVPPFAPDNRSRNAHTAVTETTTRGMMPEERKTRKHLQSSNIASLMNTNRVLLHVPPYRFHMRDEGPTAY